MTPRSNRFNVMLAKRLVYRALHEKDFDDMDAYREVNRLITGPDRAEVNAYAARLLGRDPVDRRLPAAS